MLASIFQRLYKSDLASTYYTSNKITYEPLKSFGVIYKMKVYSSISSGRDRHKIVTRNMTDLTKSERDKIVREMYPKFIEELKGNILDYAKTLKSIKKGESIMFQVILTECNTCEIPKKVNVSVKYDVLLEYDLGKLSREKALKEINVKESMQ